MPEPRRLTYEQCYRILPRVTLMGRDLAALEKCLKVRGHDGRHVYLAAVRRAWVAVERVRSLTFYAGGLFGFFDEEGSAMTNEPTEDREGFIGGEGI